MGIVFKKSPNIYDLLDLYLDKEVQKSILEECRTSLELTNRHIATIDYLISKEEKKSAIRVFKDKRTGVNTLADFRNRLIYLLPLEEEITLNEIKRLKKENRQLVEVNKELTYLLHEKNK